MNNRIQQRFDRSIREAVAETEVARARRPRRAVVRTPAVRERAPRGRLYLDPLTGATVWDPSGRRP